MSVAALPYIGIVPDIAGGRLLPGTDTEFLSPDRVIAYLRTLAPPGVWTVVQDYPCVLPSSTIYYATGHVCFDDPDCLDDLLSTTPDPAPEDAVSGIITSGDGEVFVKAFATAASAGETLPAGPWSILLYATNTGQPSTTNIYITVRHGDDTETPIETITAVTPLRAGGAINIEFDMGEFTLDAGDRLVVRIYCVASDPVLATDAIYFWGTTNPTALTVPHTRTFTTPAGDAAPWTVIDGVSVLDYAPQAADLLGIIITDIKGLDSTISRNVTPKAIDLEGGTLEKEHAGPREVKVTGVAVATSSMGIEWAERWLARVLTAPLCDSCREDAYSFRQCCPSADDPYLGYWAIYNAGLLEGPTFTPLDTVNAEAGDLTRQSCYLAHVEFTIGSEDPFLYKPMVEVATDTFSCYTPDPAFQYVGIDGYIVDFNDATAGSLDYIDYLGNYLTLFTFSIAGAARLVWDGARQRILIFDGDGTLLYPYAFISTEGLPLDWPEINSECGYLAPQQICPNLADGGGATIYRRHKEFG